MITLHTWTTPNGRKPVILLEELGLPYRIVPVNIGKDEQFRPEFLAISPNNKVPALVDDSDAGAPLTMFESGAILTYLAERHGRLLAPDGHARYRALEWLHWQIGGLGPMLGQLHHFSQEDNAAARAHFVKEADRLLTVLDKHLAGNTYMAGDADTIADIAVYTWSFAATDKLRPLLGDKVDGKPALQRWLSLVGARPAVKRGMDWKVE